MSFSDNLRTYECTDCPAGYFCVANSTEYASQDCPIGYYCPLGTEYDIQYPCPKGSYNPNLNAVSMDDCQLCDPGKYCAG